MRRCLRLPRMPFLRSMPMLTPLFPLAALHVVLESPATRGSLSATIGWTWGHSLCVPVRPQLLHALISLLIAPVSGHIRFIRLLLFVLTHAHLLHVGVLHLAHGRPRARRIRCRAHRCPRDIGVRGSDDVPPIYCVWDSSALKIPFAYLEGHSGLD